jgi:hypothetical protein
VPANKASSLLQKAMQTNQHGLCPVVTGYDDLGRPGKHNELLVATLVMGRGASTKSTSWFMPLLHWHDPSLVKGVAPKFYQYIANKIQAGVWQKNDKWHHQPSTKKMSPNLGKMFKVYSIKFFCLNRLIMQRIACYLLE